MAFLSQFTFGLLPRLLTAALCLLLMAPSPEIPGNRGVQEEAIEITVTSGNEIQVRWCNQISRRKISAHPIILDLRQTEKHKLENVFAPDTYLRYLRYRSLLI